MPTPSPIAAEPVRTAVAAPAPERLHAIDPRDGRELFRAAFENAAIGMAIFSSTGRLLQVNRSFCEMVGYGEAELLRVDFQTITHPDDLAANLAHLASLLAGHVSTYQMTKRYLHKSGAIVVGQLNVSAVRDERGAPLHLIAQVQDITARRIAEDVCRASEAAYRSLFDLGGVGKAQADVATGRFLRVNPKLCEITGYAADELLTMSFRDLTHPDDRAETEGALARLVSDRNEPYRLEKRYVRKGGESIWVEVTADVTRDAAGRALHAVGIVQDITERKLAGWFETDRRDVMEMVAHERPLAAVMARVVALVERQLGDAPASILLAHDGAMVHVAGTLPPAMVDRVAPRTLTLAAGLADLYRDAGRPVATSALAAERLWDLCRAEATAAGLAGCWFLPVVLSDGWPIGYLAAYARRAGGPRPAEERTLTLAAELTATVVERHQSSRRLAHLVNHDPLTGLPNRVCFEDRMRLAIANARRDRTLVGLFTLDIDHFKRVNDSLGHDAGDSLLQQFAQRLARTLRETDTLARMGGDEFAVVLPGLNSRDDAAVVAQTFVDCLAEPFYLGGEMRVITGSLGLSFFPDDGTDSATLQKIADEAMYRVKRKGRNGYAFA